MRLWHAILHLYLYSCFLFFFFFQAEDGIRDIGVTGVQTCALPISGHCGPGSYSAGPGDVGDATQGGAENGGLLPAQPALYALRRVSGAGLADWDRGRGRGMWASGERSDGAGGGGLDGGGGGRRGWARGEGACTGGGERIGRTIASNKINA